MTSTLRSGGMALIAVAVLYVAGFALASPMVGLEDGDNPAIGLEFIRQYAELREHPFRHRFALETSDDTRN